MTVFIYSLILAILCICIIIIAVVFLAFLILYHSQAVGTIIISVISMVFLLIIAAVGLVAVIKKSRTLCLYFAMIMVVMFVFSLVELILFATDTDFLVPKRSDLQKSAVSFFYAVTIIFMVINVIGFIDALLLRRAINKAKTGGGNYYEHV